MPVARAQSRHQLGHAVRLAEDNDHVGKPFGMAELMARLRAALRHAFQVQGEIPVYSSGDLSVDLVRRRVTRGGSEIRLTPKEFDLLRHLVVHAGKVLTHRQLLRERSGPGAFGGCAVSARAGSRTAAQTRTRSDATDAYSDRNRGRLSSPAPARALINGTGLCVPRRTRRFSARRGRANPPPSNNRQKDQVPGFPHGCGNSATKTRCWHRP